MNEAEPASLAGPAQAVPQLRHEGSAAEGRKPAPHAERHVAREARRERGPTAMGIALAGTRLAPRARASASPAHRRAKVEIQLTGRALHCSNADTIE